MPQFQDIPPALAALAAGRDNLTTAEAAHALNRRPQTLRVWSYSGKGLIRPVPGRILGWPVAEIARVISTS